MTGDDSFVRSDTWVDAVNDVLHTIQEQQEPTFDPNTGMCIKKGDGGQRKEA